RFGKMRHVHAVTNRFFRLANGRWIRPQCGRYKRLWKKDNRRNTRLQEHVICTRTQSQLLDKMVNPYYKHKHYYVNDPYEAYHKWNNV
ncbi:hypothetical protein CAPTEDRAFT_39923, partial [Capitella teleta]